MSDDTKAERALRVLDAVYHEVGMEAAKEAANTERTPERQEKVDRILARARASLDAARAQAQADLDREAETAADGEAPKDE